MKTVTQELQKPLQRSRKGIALSDVFATMDLQRERKDIDISLRKTYNKDRFAVPR